ncbi:PfkB family carbohydrate kinase [Streptomyces sp. NPDC006332]|uniref:PfkB family carbohydrate kinase n=1 Tax=Streptomyces sp. NPDC006332 TaxID=3155456 RepID=UPI0033A1F1BB
MRGWPNAGSRPGQEHVLITFGSRGAWAAGRDARVHAPAPAVRVADTVGAGDAFTAAVLAHLADSAAKASTTLAPASLPGCCRTPWRSLPTPAPAPVPSRRTATTA